MATYKYEVKSKNYEDLSSGRVLYNQQGTTAFPVRLASELFQRCRFHLLAQDALAPYTLYDPCCGGAYLLTTLGFLHMDSVAKLYASDIQQSAVDLAARNLSLLTPQGMDQRIAHLKDMLEQYAKDSHRDALASAHRLRDSFLHGKQEVSSQCFVRDITDSTGPRPTSAIDMVLTDLPYGNMVQWNSAEDQALTSLFDNLLPLLAPHAVVAVVARKKTPMNPKGYERLERFTVGLRQASIFRNKQR